MTVAQAHAQCARRRPWTPPIRANRAAAPSLSGKMGVAMEIIDNLNRLLGDDLKQTIGRGSKLRIAASTFSIYAFEALRKELEGVEALEFIFTAPTFVAGQATDKVKKERREFYIPQAKRESSLYGSEFEIRLRNKLTQRAIARECAEWIKAQGHVQVEHHRRPDAAVRRGRRPQPPTCRFRASPAADLGYERGDAVSNLVNKIDEAPLTAAYLQTFDQIWNEPAAGRGRHRARLRAHRIGVRREQPGADLLPDALQPLRGVPRRHQRGRAAQRPDRLQGHRDLEAALQLPDATRPPGIINKLETYNGCILADSVGLGKTFTALAVIKYYELRNKSVLVLAPKKLADNWTTYNSQPTHQHPRQGPVQLRRPRPHRPVAATSGYSGQLRAEPAQLGQLRPRRDRRVPQLPQRRLRRGEGDALPAAHAQGHPAGREDQGADAVGDAGQQPLPRPQEPARACLRRRVREPLGQARHHTSRSSRSSARRRSPSTSGPSCPPRSAPPTPSCAMLDFDFFELLDAVTIARSRKHIQAFYDTADIGAFPSRLPARVVPRAAHRPRRRRRRSTRSSSSSRSSTSPSTRPLSYVFPSKMQKYVDLYDVQRRHRARQPRPGRPRAGPPDADDGQPAQAPGELGRGVPHHAHARSRPPSTHALTATSTTRTARSLDDLGAAFGDIEADDDDFEVPESAQSVGKKFQIDLADMDTASWRNDLWHDRETIQRARRGDGAHHPGARPQAPAPPAGHQRARSSSPSTPATGRC